MFHFVVGLVQFSYKSLTVSFCNVQWQRCKCEKCRRILQSRTEKSLELVSKDIIDCLLTLAIYSRINNEYKRQRNPELGTATTTTKNMKTWCSTKATTTITMCLSIQLNSTCWRLSSKHHFSCTQSVRSRRQQKQYCYIQQQCTHTHICIFKYMSVLGEDGMATNIVDIPYNSQIGKCNVRQRQKLTLTHTHTHTSVHNVGKLSVTVTTLGYVEFVVVCFISKWFFCFFSFIFGFFVILLRFLVAALSQRVGNSDCWNIIRIYILQVYFKTKNCVAPQGAQLLNILQQSCHIELKI